MQRTHSTKFILQKWAKTGLLHLALVAATGLAVLPLVWMFTTSVKPLQEVYAYPPNWIPSVFVWENFVKAWNAAPFARYTFNSVVVTGVIIVSQLFFAVLAAYVFARLKFPGRDLIFLAFLATMMVPTQAIMLPKYVMFRMWSLSDTHWALILPNLFSAFSVFFLRQNFMTIPDAYLEAARIDGAGHVWIFTNIIVPLGKGALITLTLLNFTWSWNDYLNPLIFLSTNEKLTITVGLQRFQETYSTNYALIMAGASVALIPVLVLFLAAQKYFVESFAAAGVKG